MKIIANKIPLAGLVFSVILLAWVGATGMQIWWDYQNTLERQRLTTIDISRVAEAEVRATVRAVTGMLELIADDIQADRDIPHVHRDALRVKLQKVCAAVNGCVSAIVIDPRGKLVVGSNSTTTDDVSDREYFKMAAKTGRLFVSPAIVARIPGHPIVFPIAMPVFNDNGKLVAVVAAGMKTERLTEFNELLGFTVAPAVMIFKANGDIVARNPDMAQYAGRNFANETLFTQMLPKAPNGIYESMSTLDGKERIAAYTLIKELDIVVFAGIEKTVALTNWRQRTRWTLVYGSSALVVVLAMLYLGFAILKRDEQLKSRNLELDRISRLDALTGIANRRAFDETLQQLLRLRRSDDRELSLVMLDVDHFKNYNDHYGHQAGDECLRRIAVALQNALLRDGDMVARYGGEEFAIIVNAGQSGAARVAEKMRHAVEALGIPQAPPMAEPVVTVSAGYATTATNSGTTASGLIAAADAGLYMAKKLGRNRIASAE